MNVKVRGHSQRAQVVSLRLVGGFIALVCMFLFLVVSPSETNYDNSSLLIRGDTSSRHFKPKMMDMPVETDDSENYDDPEEDPSEEEEQQPKNSNQAKKDAPVELDEEGNNINSPYYTDLDEHHHKTNPGRDSVIKKMDVSQRVPSLIKWENMDKPMKTLVTIIGAGTAGLAAARRLAAKGIHNVIILEASERTGGRVLKDTTFLDGYPIELGAAVVHRPDLVRRVANGRDFKYIEMPNGEVTFFNYSFHDWLNEHVAPDPREDPHKIVFNCPVTEVECFGNECYVSCMHGPTQRQLVVRTRYVICTASMKVMRDGMINFIPPLPDYVVKSNPAVFWKGAKVFIKFSKNFYSGKAFCLFHCPNYLPRDGELEDGECMFWDHGIPGWNVITGFIMGEAWKVMEDLKDQDRIKVFLNAIDEKLGLRGQATKYYVDHVIMDWTAQEYHRGTYASMGLEGPHVVHGGQIILAGEAFPVTEDGQGWVHGAFFSGETAADYAATHWDHILADCGSYGSCHLTSDYRMKKQILRNHIVAVPTEKGLKLYRDKMD